MTNRYQNVKTAALKRPSSIAKRNAIAVIKMYLEQGLSTEDICTVLRLSRKRFNNYVRETPELANLPRFQERRSAKNRAKLSPPLRVHLYEADYDEIINTPNISKEIRDIVHAYLENRVI